ncbi:hypothetical protein RU97_GL001426 [Enterococcus canis]|uniref:Cell fate regulator YmcA, YheA/YmcA/DUF963 family (Controls sporulation, competence, biofilm development) n=1 Tax=Enterococcus canis TaxID=214095 RepID=A0A1L8RGC7_9ENTE|nr:YlbF family regulator [Enterococcus canis]OJG18808.1 hypothetical protein RU97_GL001426 [Enterococcus canis]
MDEMIQKALQELEGQLAEHEVIRAYQEIAAKVQEHEGLQALIEEIKTAQKEAVNFAHYGKPELESFALQRADELTARFDQHPLVIRYRERLLEANDLLQHITRLIEAEVNKGLEGE